MKIVKPFEEFVKEGIAKKITPDKQRAKHLLIESERKFNSLEETMKKIGVNNNNANDYIEYCYNIIMFLVRAKMLEKGYTSSGLGAHEAEVAFARNIGLSQAEISLLDQLRYFRNGILYYGKQFDKEYAEEIIEFTNTIYKKLK